MSVTCIIQARMGSTRLPGKVLADLGGRPLLEFMLTRLSTLPVRHLVVATSELAADDPIDQLCADLGVPTFRGSQDDVLGRFAGALNAFPAHTVVRLTGDCPLSDPQIIIGAIELAERTGADYTSNTLIRTFPDGLDVEVMLAEALLTAADNATDPIEREHVTPYLYRHPERFRLAALRGEQLVGDERWTVDTAADLDFVRTIVAALAPDTTFGWERALAVVGQRTTPPSGDELVLRPATGAHSTILLEWRNEGDTVKFSKSGTPVSLDEHEGCLSVRLDTPSSRVWIAERGGKPVGTAQIEVTNGVGLVGLTVAPTDRGRGYGKQILPALQRALSLDYQVTELVADIHVDHSAAKRVFAASGFVPVADDGCFQTWRWSRATDPMPQ